MQIPRKGRVRLATSNEILELFSRLQETGSLEAVLSDSIRLACRMTGSRGGVLRSDSPSVRVGETWSLYDPEGLFETCPEDAVHQPLRFGGQCLGYLTLLGSAEAGREKIEETIKPLDTVLATIMAAAMAEIDAVGRLLTGPAFRARVGSEIARAQRYKSELSVLHLRLPGSSQPAGTDVSGGWSHARHIAEAIVSRLRESDVVGLISPNHLAMLLPGTGRLGAKIAQRRIEQLLPTIAKLDSVNAECSSCIKSFPTDGSNSNDLCTDDVPTDAPVQAASQPVKI